ncbi:hypothetical protein SCA6_000489 [Theobroma cacao]
MNDKARSNRIDNRKKLNGPFSFPRQPRSVRRREQRYLQRTSEAVSIGLFWEAATEKRNKAG